MGETLRVFLAGASGVIGRRLVPLLVEAGYEVVGTTRSAEKAASLEAAGVTPAVLDVFDRDAVERAVSSFRPHVIIHQLTDLPDALDPDRMAEVLERNARLRTEGTRNLLAHASDVGVARVIAQSIAFAYAPGPEPHREDDPLDGEESRAVTVGGVTALEEAVLGLPGIPGIMLRYGRLYGPGTWSEKPNGRGPLHVDAAAHAALLAMTRGAPGIYNIAEDDGAVSIEKARQELGFDPWFRMAP